MPSAREILRLIEADQDNANPQLLAVDLRRAADSLESIVMAQGLLAESSARDLLEELVKEKGWQIVELPMLDHAYRTQTGVYLMARSQPSGSVDYYYGDMFLVGANGINNTINVLSRAASFETTRGKRGGWNRKGISNAITYAYRNPGQYQ